MKKCIFFDVDSTLVRIEGLDFIAELKNKGEEFSLITLAAMNGTISMKVAMNKKMSSLRPSFSDFVKLGEEYINTIVPGAKETILELQDMGYDVWILTGNFQPAVGMLAEYLNISYSKVITNDIVFDEGGNYVSIDFNHPLSNNNGKLKIISNLKANFEEVIMVGDGSTDLETKAVVDKFIGFGGVSIRPIVQKNSDYFISSHDLRGVLKYVK